nr:hypothetical protein [Tanacetum cinerariifolium]
LVFDDDTKKYIVDTIATMVGGALAEFNVDDIDKVNLISIHLYDKALLWHTQFIKIHEGFVDWVVYKQTILNRFRNVYEDPMSELKNLKYETTARAYEDAFDTLLSRVEISEPHAISLFMGGLPAKIVMGVRMFKPKTLSDAYCLTNLQEATLNAVKRKNKHVFGTNNSRLEEEEDLFDVGIAELQAPQISLHALSGPNVY